MPGVFDVPVTAPIWNGVSVDPLAAADSLPPQYADLKGRIVETVLKVNNARAERDKLEKRVFYRNGLTAEQQEAFKIVNADLERWKKADQYTFDTFVEKMYLVSIDSTNSTLFTDWYLTQLKAQIEEIKTKLNVSFATSVMFLVRENEIKNSFKDYQEYIIQTQKVWLNYLEKQIHEQLQLITDLQNLSNTEGRRSQFVVNEVIDYNTVTFWVRIVFWTLFIVLVCYLIYLRFGAYMREKAQQLAKKIAEKTPASVKQAVERASVAVKEAMPSPVKVSQTGDF